MRASSSTARCCWSRVRRSRFGIRRREPADVASRALHPPAGDDEPPDAVVRRVRPVRLPPIAGRGAAARRFPHHQRHGAIARRQSGHDGVLGRRSAGTRIRDDPRDHDDDVVVGARHDLDHNAVRPRPQHRRRGARRAVEHLLDTAQAAPAIARAAELSEAQSGGQPDSVHRTGVEDAAADEGRRLRRAGLRRADLADHRRRAGARFRTAEIRRARLGRSRQSRGARPDARQRQQLGGGGQFLDAGRRAARPPAERHGRCDRPDGARGRIRQSRRRLAQRLAGPSQGDRDGL